MRRLLYTLTGLVVLFMAYCAVQASRAEYLEFDRQREAWHHRCDAYVGTNSTAPAARDCERELQVLIAYAKRKGW